MRYGPIERSELFAYCAKAANHRIHLKPSQIRRLVEGGAEILEQRKDRVRFRLPNGTIWEQRGKGPLDLV